MFKNAVPVFAKGISEEMNYTLVLRQEVDVLSDTKLLLTAFSFYKLSVNGKFVAFGPARTAKGYARVDEILLGDYNVKGKNVIVIEVVGFFCRSLSTVKQPSFVIAELRRGEEVLLYTGKDFKGYRSSQKLQKVERYSLQRHFGEVWDHTERDIFNARYQVDLDIVNNGLSYLPRVAPYPIYPLITSEGFSSFGSFELDESKLLNMCNLAFKTDEHWGTYNEEEIPYKPYRWVQSR